MKDSGASRRVYFVVRLKLKTIDYLLWHNFETLFYSYCESTNYIFKLFFCKINFSMLFEPV